MGRDGAGGGARGGEDSDFSMVSMQVLAILKTCSTRLELRNYSRMFTNLWKQCHTFF